MAISAVRLSDCGAPMLPDRIFRNALIWLGVVAVSLLVMVNPVRAESSITQYSIGSSAYGNRPASGWYNSTGEAYDYWLGGWPKLIPDNLGYDPVYVGHYLLLINSSLSVTTISFSYSGDWVDSTITNGTYSILTRQWCPQANSVEVNGICPDPVVCPAAGTLHNSGYYDIGTDPSVRHPDFSPCLNGCLLSYNGSDVVARALHSGIYHYYTQGEYRHDGTTNFCTGTETTAGVNDVVSTVPTSTCAPGQTSIWGGVGGATICYDAVTGEAASGNSASAVAAAETSNAVAVASAVAAATTLAESNGLSASAVEAVRAQTIAGMALDQPGATAGAAGAQDAVLTNFCRENPSSTICVDADFGEVANVNMLENSISVAINPVSVGGAGSCPAPSPLTIRGQTYFFKWDTFCTFANGIRPILLAFAWLSAAGLMVGGFKS